jgi:hypothetical protein
MGGMRSAYRILLGKREGRRPIGMRRHRWEEIRMDLGKKGGKMLTGCIWLRIATSDWLL